MDILKRESAETYKKSDLLDILKCGRNRNVQEKGFDRQFEVWAK